MNSEQKQIHKNNMLRIGAAGIEHALKAVQVDDGTKRLIERRIKSVLDHRYDVNQIRRERQNRREHGNWTYTPGNRLLEASEELVLLADFGGHISGSRLQGVLVPCWDAIGIVDSRKEIEERNWQYKNLEPLVEKCFRNQGYPFGADETA